MTEEAFVEAPAAGGMNAADPVQVRTLDQLVRDKSNQDAADLKAVLALPEGRRFVFHLLDYANVYGSTFHLSHASMSLLEGRRDVGLWLIKALESVDPLAYPRLLAEGAQLRELEQQIREARISAARKATEE
jgi:hypothetical protein